MMDRYIFIDETGDLGEKGTKYFIITAIWTDDNHVFDRLIKNMRRHKFKKELHKAQEIKANKSSKELRKYLLTKFSEIENAHAQSIILEKKKNYSEYLKKDKNKLYNYVCGNLGTIDIDSKNIIIRIDKSKGKQVLIDDFNQYLERKFKEGKWNRKVSIYHNYSQSWSGIQIADVVSWAVFQKYEHDNDFFFKIIEKKLNINHMWK